MKAGQYFALAALFAGAAGPVALHAQVKDYTVVSSRLRDNITINLPDRELPPQSAGQRRTAAERWVKQIPVAVQTYITVLEDAQGQRVQCIGVKLDNASDVGRGVLPHLNFDALATSLPMLRALHPDPKVPAWPLQMGGCITVTPHDAQNDYHEIQIKLGEDIVGYVAVPIYENETHEQIMDRMMRKFGGGVSISGNRWMKCPSAGWNEELGRAQPGKKVGIGGICPR
jgi:hypothetical protein